jgi:hypothetical protein
MLVAIRRLSTGAIYIYDDGRRVYEHGNCPLQPLPDSRQVLDTMSKKFRKVRSARKRKSFTTRVKIQG